MDPASAPPVDDPPDASPSGPGPFLPGLALAAGGVALAWVVSAVVPGVSVLLVAIVLGVVVGNTMTMPTAWGPGLGFAAKHLLRAGVVLLGLQLVLSQVASLGPQLLAVVVVVVAVGLLATLALGRLLRTGRELTILVACGFSICGAAAVAAADTVVEAEEEDVVTAIALVVLFGTLMIPALPAVVLVLGLGAEQGATWAGAAIHEVAQVVAAGEAIGSTADGAADGAAGGAAGGATLLALAVTVKLARVLMLAPVVATLRLQARRSGPVAGSGSRPPIVPAFVLGFVALALVRSTGVLPDVVVDVGQLVQVALLAAAMFALGTGVQIRSLTRTGPRPFVLAGLSTLVVSTTALVGVLLTS